MKSNELLGFPFRLRAELLFTPKLMLLAPSCRTAPITTEALFALVYLSNETRFLILFLSVGVRPKHLAVDLVVTHSSLYYVHWQVLIKRLDTELLQCA